MNRLGTWIRTLRKDAGMTQGQLAKRAKCSVAYISALELDRPHSTSAIRVQPSRQIVDRIARALGADIDEARIAAGYLPEDQNARAVQIDLGDNIYLNLLNGKRYTEEARQEFADMVSIAVEIAKRKILKR